MSDRKSDNKDDESMTDVSSPSSPSPSPPSSSPFTLSAQLVGHDYSVRDVSICDSTLLATCEERGRMRIFTARLSPSTPSFSLTAPPSSSRLVWSEVPVFTSPVHLGLTFVVECVRNRSPAPSPSPYPPATFMSGGNDKAARPFTSNGSLLAPLEPHPAPVNSISVTPTGHTVTGCWDGVVRVWDGPTRLYEVVGHEHAVEVLAIDDVIVSASANKSIHLIKGGKVVKKIPHAHDHTIRKLVRHPLGFVSAGNDGMVKVWSLQGDELQAIEAHVGSEVKFVYGVGVIGGTEELVTCGEDRQVKVWRGGECVQVIPHPGPVRAVKVMDNGDVVTACTDRVARIWTRDVLRYAEQKERDEYDEGIQAIAVANMEAIDPATLQGEEALTVPGKKDQEVKVINVVGKGPTAYQWSEEAQTWVEVGSVMGKSNKQMVDGVEFDSVTTVFVSETQSVKLGVNRDDDPFEVADRFCALYDLPADVKGQIVAHVRPLTNEAAAAERKRREKEEAERESLKQVPGWKHGGLEVYASINAKGMKEKIHQGNDALKSLNPSDLATVDRLIDDLADTKSLHVLEWNRERTRVLLRLLQWPAEWSPAVLDCVRVAMVSAGGVEALGEDTEVHRLLREQVKAGKDVHLTLFLKIYCNFIAKRKKRKGERPPKPSVDAGVVAVVREALGVGRPGVGAGEKVVEGYMLLLHNVVSWLGRLGAGEEGVGGQGVDALEMQVVEGVVGVLKAEGRSVKAEYYGLLCVGSIGYAVRGMRGVVMGKYKVEVEELVRRGKGNDNQAVREVAADVERLFITHP